VTGAPVAACTAHLLELLLLLLVLQWWFLLLCHTQAAMRAALMAGRQHQ
jgi:hypothetical protein